MTTKRVLHYRALSMEQLAAFSRSQELSSTLDRIYMEMSPQERDQLVSGYIDDDPTKPGG